MSVNLSFDIGQKALRASQLGLTVTGQNIANVNTVGYTRQEVSLANSPPINVSGLVLGTGVDVTTIQAFRSEFIENRLRTETSTNSRLIAQQQALSPLESAFNDTGPGGINAGLNNFFSAFRNLDANASSLPLRINVIENAEALGKAFSATRSRLVDIQSQANNLVENSVGEVNFLLDKVAELNTKIGLAENTGNSPSDLIDQRNTLLGQISEFVDINVTRNIDSTIAVSLSDGRPLILNDKAFALKTISTPPNGLKTVTLNGEVANINNGKIKGLLDSIEQIGLKITDLDNFANSLATKVNSLHQNASDLNGNLGASFFVSSDGNAINASNLTVSSSIKTDPKLLAVAENGKGNGDGTIARQIANLLTDNNSQAGNKTGSFSSIYASYVGEAGQLLKTTEDSLLTQQAILNQTNEQRNAFSGVSLDEETVNLLRYQRAFEAAARFLKVSDEITRTIIALGE